MFKARLGNSDHRQNEMGTVAQPCEILVQSSAQPAAKARKGNARVPNGRPSKPEGRQSLPKSTHPRAQLKQTVLSGATFDSGLHLSRAGDTQVKVFGYLLMSKYLLTRSTPYQSEKGWLKSGATRKLQSPTPPTEGWLRTSCPTDGHPEKCRHAT